MLPAGEYYIGDLCYVFSRDKWQRLLEATDYLRDGEFKFENIHGASYGTAHGDGGYDENNLGTEIGVDSGTIGCILLTDIEPEELSEAKRCGAIYTFTNSFKVSEHEGTIHFGDRFINTDPDYEDDWDEEDEDDD